MKYNFGNIHVTAKIEDKKAEKVHSLSDIKKQYKHLRKKPKEHFYTVFLNSDNKVIGDKLIGLGNNWSTSVDVKDIARTAALTNASAVILVHNHPSTNNKATKKDIETNLQIERALELLQVEVLDHVIISQNDCYSMKFNGDPQTTD